MSKFVQSSVFMLSIGMVLVVILFCSQVSVKQTEGDPVWPDGSTVADSDPVWPDSPALTDSDPVWPDSLDSPETDPVWPDSPTYSALI